ncbi:hypothetical protein BH10BAC2_BH10BAC2_31150 [soil metagenome]
MQKLLLFIFLLITANAQAQTTGDYRSAASGNWSDAATWQRFNGSNFVAATIAPSNTDGLITIRSGHTVTVNTGVTTDQTVVALGGILTQTSTLTVADGTGDDIIVNGTYNFFGGTLNGSGNVVVTGGMEWQTGNIQINVMLTAGSVSSKTTTGAAGINSYYGNPILTNNGAFTWTDGNFNMDYGTFSNGATGVITAIGNNTILPSGGGGSGNAFFNNAGIFTKTTGTGTTAITVNGFSSGKFNVNAGTVSSGATFSNTGTINIGVGNTFLVNGGNFTLGTGSSSTGAGKFQLSAGTVTITAPTATPATANNFLFSGGDISGATTCTLTVTGGMEWQTGSLHTNLVLAAGSVSSKTTTGAAGINSYYGNPILTNNGAFTWTDGNFNMDYGTFSNGATGVITAIGNNTILPNGGGGSGNAFFNNAGIFTKTTGTGTTAITVNGFSSGKFNVNAGTVSSGAAFSNTGTINIPGGKIFLVNGGNFTLGTGSSSTGAGKFQLSAGTVTITAPTATPATASNFLFSGGEISGESTCTFTVTGGMEWQTGSVHTNVLLAQGSVNSKTTVGVAGINSYYGNPILTNNGTFEWVAGNFDMNYGTFNNGATGVITATGDNNIGASGGSHAFNNAGTFTKSSTGTTTISVASSNTGIVKGIGTLNFSNSFTSSGIIAPGTSPGLLTINGVQPLSASSTLNIELLNGSGAGTGHDQLSRDGSLTLAGTLNVVETGSVPAGVYTIVNCTSGTINGSFATVNLPPCYTLQITSTTVQLTKVQPPAPTVSVSGATTFCQGGNVTLTSSSALGNTWSNGATTKSIIVNTSGSYSVTFTNASGCTSPASAATLVTVNPLPAKPTISTNSSTTFCQGGNVVLTSSAASGNVWSNGATTKSITVNTSGNYSVTATNANGCTSAASAATAVTVNPLPAKPTISANGSTTFCQGGSVTLTSSIAAGNVWSNGATTQSITVNTSGSYSITRTNANGCSVTSTATIITVNPNPAPATTPAGTVNIVSPNTVNIGTNGTFASYLWSTGATTQSITVGATGSYSVTVTNASGCTGISAPVMVNVRPAIPIISIANKSINEGNSDTTAMVFVITLNHAYDSTVTIRYKTANKTATAGSDYVLVNKVLNFTAGQVRKNVTIKVIGDVTVEPNEQFKVILINPVNTILGSSDTALGTIRNDDVASLLNTAVNDAVKKITLTITPNPAKDVLNIYGVTPGGIASIYSAEGSLILRTKFTSTTGQINISKLAAGMYVFHYMFADKKQVIKFLKQ